MERIESDTRIRETTDEIDLSELVKSLYRGKLLISIIVLLCSFTGFYYAYFLAIPKYESIAIFNLKDEEKSQFNFGGLEALTSFSGVRNLTASSENVLDQITGADFLRKVVESEKLYLDQEFFTQPSKVRESWLENKKVYFKRKLGLNNEPRTLNQKDIVNATVKTLAKKFTAKKTKNGAYEISVTSKNAAKSSFLANSLLDA